MALRPSVLIDGGPRERAQLFRAALAEGRAVSVGYRKGGKLEVRDLTGCDFYYTFSRWPQQPMAARRVSSPRRPSGGILAYVLENTDKA